jgi:hypothetical protein
MDKLVFLGFMISEFGVSPAPTLIQAIKVLRAPTIFSGDRSIIGLISYPRKCVDHISINIEPLIRLTRKNVNLFWGKEQELALSKIKNIYIS